MNVASVTRSLRFWLAALVSLQACSSRSARTTTSEGPDAGAGLCEPFASRVCVGATACRGGQVCAADGSGWSVCDCGDAGGSGGSAGALVAGGGGAGTGGGTGGAASGGASGAAGDTGGTSSSSGGSGGSSSGGSSSGGSGGGAGCEVELLSDGAFDLGLGSWDTFTETNHEAIVAESESPIAAHSPPNLGWLAGEDFAEDWMSQVFTVTVPMADLKLSLYVYVETLETDPTPYDLFAAKIRVGTEIETVLTLDNTDASGGYVRYEVDLPPALAGTSMELSLETSTDTGLPTAFYVDSVSVIASTCD